MAQWSLPERTLYAKLVYYGPAFGGKTTNLEVLHRVTDPERSKDLLSVKTSEDRTLFFDLLPFDIGTILGYRVALKLFTVPGQVCYETTRRVVLAGADAVIFVADSTPGREQDNRESLAGLDRNLEANGLDPARFPKVVQFNKQDVEGARSVRDMAQVLGHDGVPAVALHGEGVLETFLAASRKMLDRLVSLAPERVRSGIDREELADQLERVFAPLEARCRSRSSLPDIPTLVGQERDSAIVLGSDADDATSAEAVVELGARLASERAKSARLHSESAALRQLSEMVRDTTIRFDRASIVDRALDTVSEVVGAAVVSLVTTDGIRSSMVASARVRGRTRDPLMSSPSGARLLERVASSVGPCVVDDLAEELADRGPGPLAGLRALASVPVDREGRARLLAYAPDPDGRFEEVDVRFLATVAAHLAVGLEKVELHDRLERHNDRLEADVRARTAELHEAYEDMQALERAKDRFVSNVSHEMRTPLTAILSAATCLRDYDADGRSRREMIDTILASCETLREHLDRVFRTVRLESVATSLERVDTDVRTLLDEAIALVGCDRVEISIDPGAASVRADPSRLARALANLIDNAVKFSSDGRAEVRVRPLETADGAVEFTVLDRGDGPPREDSDRLFQAFEQGGDVLRDKPTGLGLGLHEARVVARRHGGELVWEARDGGGSRFRLTIAPAVCAGVGESVRA